MAIFLRGNSRDVLKGLPGDFIHCAVTSPPYYGLRKYDGGEEVWDGDPGCEHEWGEELPGVNRGGSGTPTDKNNRGEGYARGESKGCYCRLCGAWRGQLGSEPSPDLYIQHLVEICREVRRVLRPDGVFWLNVGDSWAGSWGDYGARNSCQRPTDNPSWGRPGYKGYEERPPTSYKMPGVKPLDMILVPEQLALALRADGWYVRSVLIWAKGVSLSDEFNGNPMPESVNGWRWEKHKIKVGNNGRGQEPWRAGASDRPQQDHDGKNFQPSALWADCSGCSKCTPNGGYILRKGSWRPTDAYEQILMLTKTGSYYCDREAVLERAVYAAGEKRNGGSEHKSLESGSRTTEGLHNKDWNGTGGRNLRSVLTIPTAGFSGAHFAVFPPRLVEPLVRAATSERGCCPRCGSPWARVIDRTRTTEDMRWAETGGLHRADAPGAVLSSSSVFRTGKWAIPQTVGWLPTCSCVAGDPVPCRLLDPFSGAGTTALVCERLGLDSIGIDTSEEYIKLAESRLAEDEEKRVQEQVAEFRRMAKQEARIAKSNKSTVDG